MEVQESVSTMLCTPLSLQPSLMENLQLECSFGTWLLMITQIMVSPVLEYFS